MNNLMCESDLARYLGVSSRVVWLLRVRHEGPPCRETAFGPEYRRDEVDAWIEAQRRYVEPTRPARVIAVVRDWLRVG